MVKSGRHKNALKLLRVRENPESLLSTVQIGITVFGTLASVIGGVLSIRYVEPLVREIPYLSAFADTLSLIIVVFFLTFTILVFGELVPKHIGINYREAAALRIVPFFDVFSKLFFCLIQLLNASTNAIVRIFGLKKMEEAISEDEIKILLEEGRLKGVFGRIEEEMIHGVFNFVDRSVKEIMVPRPNIYAIDIEEAQDRVLEYIIENEFSRYPVYRDHVDNIIGIVYHKDIARHIWKKEPLYLEKLLKKGFFVPDSMKLSMLLKEMQRRRMHLAIVVDEYGATVGIVTLEDIVEEIFGEIMDETDTDVRIERAKDGSALVDGAYSIRDLNHELNFDLPESPEYETLGGFMLTRLQGMPRGGEIIHHNSYRLTVVGLVARRISKVKLERLGVPDRRQL
jgi:putative hemolysin